LESLTGKRNCIATDGRAEFFVLIAHASPVSDRKAHWLWGGNRAAGLCSLRQEAGGCDE
jgi:hypothetical protein